MTLVRHPRCPYCHEGVRPAQRKTACLGCMSWHHLSCWDELGRCAACARRRALGLRALKPEDPRRCPSCGSAGALQQGEFERLRLTFCSRCWGGWVPKEHLGALLLESVASPFEQAPSPEPRPYPALACLECRELMTPWAWRDLVVRVCEGHGLWLESGDLLHLARLASAHPGELYGLLAALGVASDEGPALPGEPAAGELPTRRSEG